MIHSKILLIVGQFEHSNLTLKTGHLLGKDKNSSMKTQWIVYKNMRILLADYSNCGMNSDQVKSEMQFAINLASKEPRNSVLTLTDVRGTKGSPEIINLMKDTAAKIAPFASKRAVVGMAGIQRTFMEMINKIFTDKPFSMFDDIEKAKEWLSTN